MQTEQSPLDVALAKVARCEPLTPEEERLVDASMPMLTEEDLRKGEEVDAEAFLAHLRGERSEDPCAAA
jgi:hypothetical protein